MSEINFVGFDPKNDHYNGEYILYKGIISYYDTRCDKPLGLISNKEINLSLKNPSSTLNHTVYLYHPDNFDYWCLIFKGNNGDPRYFNPYLNQKKEAKWILKFKIRNITRKKYYSDHVVSQSALKSYHQTRFPKVTIPYNDIYSIANAMIDGEIKGNTCNRELNGVLEQLCSLDLNFF